MKFRFHILRGLILVLPLSLYKEEKQISRLSHVHAVEKKKKSFPTVQPWCKYEVLGEKCDIPSVSNENAQKE